MSQPPLRQDIRTFALVMLIASAIDSIRNLPATALFGSHLIFFFCFAAVVFLIPVTMVSAELGATFTDKGGIYHWTRLAFGKNVAVLAIWLQWINTMVWYPTILSFIAGTLAYLINPNLIQNKLYLVSIILSTFWLLTCINLRGLQTSARFASMCAILGLILPMLLIIGLAISWLASGRPVQIDFSWHNILPNLHHFDNWTSLTAIITAFLGMELASVHISNIQDPARTYPKAMFYAVLIILSTMLFGALAIAIVLPALQINLIAGVMQAFSSFLTTYDLAWLVPVIAVMLFIGSLGEMINWMISPAKGLKQAAQNGFLPQIFVRENKQGVAHVILITQAILVSLVCFSFLLMPTINASYWLLTDLSTQLYLCMYVIMFIAAIILKFKYANQNPAIKIPGGKTGFIFTCLLGLSGTLITIGIGFFPPLSLKLGTQHYDLIFSFGLLLMLAPVVLLYAHKYYVSRP